MWQLHPDGFAWMRLELDRQAARKEMGRRWRTAVLTVAAKLPAAMFDQLYAAAIKSNLSGGAAVQCSSASYFGLSPTVLPSTRGLSSSFCREHHEALDNVQRAIFADHAQRGPLLSAILSQAESAAEDSFELEVEFGLRLIRDAHGLSPVARDDSSPGTPELQKALATLWKAPVVSVDFKATISTSGLKVALTYPASDTITLNGFRVEELDAFRPAPTATHALSVVHGRTKSGTIRLQRTGREAAATVHLGSAAQVHSLNLETGLWTAPITVSVSDGNGLVARARLSTGSRAMRVCRSPRDCVDLPADEGRGLAALAMGECNSGQTAPKGENTDADPEHRLTFTVRFGARTCNLQLEEACFLDERPGLRAAIRVLRDGSFAGGAFMPYPPYSGLCPYSVLIDHNRVVRE